MFAWGSHLWWYIQRCSQQPVQRVKNLLEKFCCPDTCFIFILGNSCCLSFSKRDKSLHLHPWHGDLEAKNPTWESGSTEILLFARQGTPHPLPSYICPWPRGVESNRLRVRPGGYLVLPPFLYPSLPTYGDTRRPRKLICTVQSQLAVSSVNFVSGLGSIVKTYFDLHVGSC